MFDSRTLAIVRAVTSIDELTREDGHFIAMLGLSIYESMVVGHLRRAVWLLSRDATYTEAQRRELWRTWERETSKSLDGALRYRERQSLVIAIAIVGDLIPGLYPQAKTISYYTAFRALLLNAKRRWSPKMERRQRPIQLTDIVQRTPLWLTSQGTLESGRMIDEEQRVVYVRSGYKEVWGVEMHAYLVDWRSALHRVRGALPIITDHCPDDVILVAPLPPLW